MKKLGKFLCVIAEIAAVFFVIALLLHYLNGIYNFMPVIGGKILGWISQFGLVILVCLMALGGIMQTKSLILTILVGLFIAALIGFTFYYGILTGFLPKGSGSSESALAALIG
ncbi:MAG: hypothetical protein NC131_04575 [Roseburia sp.]|nr:hypothetical protein [Roseburia sp.]